MNTCDISGELLVTGNILCSVGLCYSLLCDRALIIFKLL